MGCLPCEVLAQAQLSCGERSQMPANGGGVMDSGGGGRPFVW